jgi:hypothetical protein
LERSMATPRKRYPSDDARLSRPPGVYVAFSIRNPDDPEQARVFNDAELRGIWTGLLVVAGQAFAGRTQDRVTLSFGDISWVTGRRTQAGAELALTRVCALMGYEVSSNSGRSWTVHVRNLSQNQGWTPRERGATPHTTSASESYSEIESYSDIEPEKKEEKKPAVAGPVPREPRTPRGRRKAPETEPPERLDAEQLDLLRSWAAGSEDPEIKARAGRVQELSAACLDWARGTQTTSADWVARVRNWIRKDVQLARERGSAGRVVQMRGSRPLVSNSAWDAYPRTETGT